MLLNQMIPPGDVRFRSVGGIVFCRPNAVTVIDLRVGDELDFAAPLAFLLQTDLWETLQQNGLLENLVLVILVCFSIFSWTVIFAKWLADAAMLLPEARSRPASPSKKREQAPTTPASTTLPDTNFTAPPRGAQRVIPASRTRHRYA